MANKAILALHRSFDLKPKQVACGAEVGHPGGLSRQRCEQGSGLGTDPQNEGCVCAQLSHSGDVRAFPVESSAVHLQRSAFAGAHGDTRADLRHGGQITDLQGLHLQRVGLYPKGHMQRRRGVFVDGRPKRGYHRVG